MNKGDSFSFDEIQGTNRGAIPSPLFINASDGIKLAYYEMKVNNPVASLIFIHGGGAYSGAGYQFFANGLNDKYRVSVYLLDLRGHGNSEGPRGDAPSARQVFDDIQQIYNIVKNDNPGIPLYLGGHSSGAGLILNYLTQYKNEATKGYIFISPEFGYKSKTAREDIGIPFAKVKIWMFVLNAISSGRLFGNSRAVFLNYTDSILKKHPLMINSYTCNMALALTPNDPQKQFTDIDKPFGLFIGANDELINPKKVIEYSELANVKVRGLATSKILENEKHLSILGVADKIVGEAILKINKY
jgi:alpha-beta hydrolase superfamily lysophospholipase